MFSGWELLAVLLIVLLLFGGTRLPAVLEGLGRGLRALKRAANGQDELAPGPGERGLDSEQSARVEPPKAEAAG
jgi:sec-independent protein translocase protein TatA